MNQLQRRERIQGTALTLEELLNPVEEHEVGAPERQQYPATDAEIIEEVHRQMDESHSIESDDENNDDSEPAAIKISVNDGMDLCERMEMLSMTHSNAAGVDFLLLQRQLRSMRAHLRQISLAEQKQSTLDSFFPSTMDTS